MQSRFALAIMIALLMTGCAVAQQPPAESSTPAVSDDPPVQPPHRFSVAEDTKDPDEVRVGVTEWLHQHPEFSPAMQEAVLHRMWQESRFEPCVTQGPHKYLLQWRGPRLSTLASIAHTRIGVCPRWLDQMEHMSWELHNYPQFRQFLHANAHNAYGLFAHVYLGGRG